MIDFFGVPLDVFQCVVASAQQRHKDCFVIAGYRQGQINSGQRVLGMFFPIHVVICLATAAIEGTTQFLTVGHGLVVWLNA